MLRAGLGRLKAKVAVITGANSGIGRATARLFAREGAKVVCCDIQETITPRIDEVIKSEGGQAVFAKIDVTKQEDCDRMLTTALENYGDMDILYNNAGGGIRKKLHEHTDEEWNFVLNLNLNGMFRGARAVLPHFIKKRSGNIVTTASTFGLLASAEYPGYCATKADLAVKPIRCRARPGAAAPVGIYARARRRARHRQRAASQLPGMSRGQRRSRLS